MLCFHTFWKKKKKKIKLEMQYDVINKKIIVQHPL